MKMATSCRTTLNCWPYEVRWACGEHRRGTTTSEWWARSFASYCKRCADSRVYLGTWSKVWNSSKRSVPTEIQRASLPRLFLLSSVVNYKLDIGCFVQGCCRCIVGFHISILRMRYFCYAFHVSSIFKL